jgi:hypothetical protein
MAHGSGQRAWSRGHFRQHPLEFKRALMALWMLSLEKRLFLERALNLK